MSHRLCKLLLSCALLAAAPGITRAADQEIPRKPAPPAKSATASKPFTNIWKQRELSGSTNACMEWTDGCRSCQRNGPDSFTCSNVGIACVQTAGRCTRSNPQ